MARIVLGNRDGVLALHQARSVLHQLTDEWPDVNLVLRTLPNSSSADAAVPVDDLLDALKSGSIGIAIVQAETLPAKLPEGLVIAAVSRRLEPRCALVSRTKLEFDELPAGAKIGASLARDGRFLDTGKGPRVLPLDGSLDDAFALLTTGDLDAVIASAADLHALGHRNRATVLLDPHVLTPAVGQGATALVVRADDDPSFEIAYSLQHRPSFDRLLAERSFAEALLEVAGEEPLVGALANVTDDGQLTLHGAVVRGGEAVHVRAAGKARDAQTLGAELGRALAEQLSAA